MRFKTLKALAEYAQETNVDNLGAIDTVTIAIEQGWVYMSPHVRSRLLTNRLELDHYVLNLLHKHYKKPDNVVSIFSRVPLDADKSIKDNDYFDNVIKQNKETADKLKDQRGKSNQSILRSYRMKK